jgi:hypothetical protein
MQNTTARHTCHYPGSDPATCPACPQSPTSHFDPLALVARVNRERMGFLTEADVAQLASAASSRLWPVLVRCGGCRFTAPVQDIKHLIGIITREKSDYVRDVALVAGVTYR